MTLRRRFTRFALGFPWVMQLIRVKYPRRVKTPARRVLPMWMMCG